MEYESVEAELFREFLADPATVEELERVSQRPVLSALPTDSFVPQPDENSESDDDFSPPTSPSLAAVRIEALTASPIRNLSSSPPSLSPVAAAAAGTSASFSPLSVSASTNSGSSPALLASTPVGSGSATTPTKTSIASLTLSPITAPVEVMPLEAPTPPTDATPVPSLTSALSPLALASSGASSSPTQTAPAFSLHTLPTLISEANIPTAQVSMPLPPPPRAAYNAPEPFPAIEFLSRLSLAHSQWSGKPSVPPHLAPSLLFPPAALAHITVSLFGLSAYCHAAIFDKLLLFQHLWHLDPENNAHTVPAVFRVAENAVAASQGLPLKPPPASEVEPLILGATIHRFYATLLASLDREARLFYALLPVPPPSAPDLRPIPPEALRQWFLVDLPGCTPSMPVVQRSRMHTPSNNPVSSALVNEDDDILPVSRRAINLNSDDPMDAEYHDFTTPSQHVDANGKRIFPRPIPFDPKWLCHTFLEPASWAPLLLSVVDLHPGLEFLASAGDFQQRYAQTVIARLFYSATPRGDDRMLVRHLRNSDILERLDVLWSSEDVNRAHDYFSYEHFYVLYCKFWELDGDHDMLLQPQDLACYDDGAVAAGVLQRVTDPHGALTSRSMQPPLTYEQFVSFCIAEVDKTTPQAIRYWLRRLDVDCDGIVGPSDITSLLQDQVQRVREAAGDAVNIKDLACQLWDMLGAQTPKPPLCVTCGCTGVSSLHSHTSPDEASPKHGEIIEGKGIDGPERLTRADKDHRARLGVPSPRSPASMSKCKDTHSRSELLPLPGRREGVLNLSTLRQCGLSATIFDLLFNLNKFVQAEAKDINRIRAQQAGQNEWERWAAQTYYMLAGAEMEAQREQ